MSMESEQEKTKLPSCGDRMPSTRNGSLGPPVGELLKKGRGEGFSRRRERVQPERSFRGKERPMEAHGRVVI